MLAFSGMAIKGAGNGGLLLKILSICLDSGCRTLYMDVLSV